MPTGKAAGNDGITNEMLKLCSQIVSPYLVSIFNGIFDTGNFQERLCKAIIIPLYKSGDLNKVNNYRGISLLSDLSKVFTGILNDIYVKQKGNFIVFSLIFQKRILFRFIN